MLPNFLVVCARAHVRPHLPVCFLCECILVLCFLAEVDFRVCSHPVPSLTVLTVAGAALSTYYYLVILRYEVDLFASMCFVGYRHFSGHE